MQRADFPFLGFGVGLRRQHYEAATAAGAGVDWLEVITENFMVPGGKPLAVLEKARERYELVLHGVSLSIGSTDPLNLDYLKDVKALAGRFKPAWVSDHLCWTGATGRNLHDLLPLPHNEEALRHVVQRMRQVQDILERPLALENVSTYLRWRSSEMTEWEFVRGVAEEADCAILLDLNNVYVNAFNHGFDPFRYLDGLPAERVVQYHIAGHDHQGTHIIDSHDRAVSAEVWGLYAHAARRFGPVSLSVEWDENIPDFPTLTALAQEARQRFEAARHGDNASARDGVARA